MSRRETPYSSRLAERLGSSFFKSIPRGPGVYFMHDRQGQVLYIGKAKNLKNRLHWYKNAKPEKAPDRILEMIEHIDSIRWEEHPTESDAFIRESELLHAVRPPFNVASTWALSYLYLGYKAEKCTKLPDRLQIHWQLTSRRELARGYRLFGCFKHRGRTKEGYKALLRLIHATSPATPKQRFGFPARITRRSPPYLYSSLIHPELMPYLRPFLSGKSLRLLRRLVELLLENESIPRFMRPALQDDIQTVQEFFKRGPQATQNLRDQHGIRSSVISHRRMEQLLRWSMPDSGSRGPRDPRRRAGS